MISMRLHFPGFSPLTQHAMNLSGYCGYSFAKKTRQVAGEPGHACPLRLHGCVLIKPWWQMCLSMGTVISKKTPVDFLGETSFQATTLNTCQCCQYLLYRRRRHLYVTGSFPLRQAYMDQCGASVKHNTTKEGNTLNQRGVSTVAISG